MAMAIGTETQRAFFDKVGFLKPLNAQLTELGRAAGAAALATINTMTIAFGHGISVTPLAPGGRRRRRGQRRHLYLATLRQAQRRRDPGRRVIQAKTSVMMRRLMRLKSSTAPARRPTYRATWSAARPARPKSLRARLPPRSPDQLVRRRVPDERSESRCSCRSTSPRAPPERRLRDRPAWSRRPRRDGHRRHRVALRHPAGRPEGGPAADRNRLDSAAGTKWCSRSSCRRTHAIGAQDPRKALPAGPGPNQMAAAPAAGVRRVAAE